jgi:hypothetical protein
MPASSCGHPGPGCIVVTIVMVTARLIGVVTTGTIVTIALSRIKGHHFLAGALLRDGGGVNQATCRRQRG